MKDHMVKTSIHIDAPASRVWATLTEPEEIKKFLFGTQVETDWRPGSPIAFKGTWQGKSYEDKGRVLEYIPNARLVHSFWSSLEGSPDKPENYKTVSYSLKPDGEGTLLTLTQDHNANEEAKRHSEDNWKQVLEGVKKAAE
jgi:uncharacterized protein YndB with AHSA1/START domain